jgi:G3E family GTPase
MIGGFLGAGKTTAILRLAEHLDRQRLRVGLITNDQSVGLVDTAVLASHDFPVEEITGGCFCCRFHSLTDAAERLEQSQAPDVFIAEPVGSCTDLRASVSYPLRKMYGDRYEVSPLSVLVDPIRGERILGLRPGRAFSPKVLYVYDRQLEEAELIIINKCDLLPADRLAALRAVLRARYPEADVLTVSARDGIALEEWFGRIASTEATAQPAMELDYELYAEGEALLGWLNSTIQLAAVTPFDGNPFVADLATEVQRRLATLGLEVAHLKMVLTPGEEAGDLAVANLVRTDGRVEFSHQLQERLETGELILNLRAEGDPEVLREEVFAAFHTARAKVEGLSGMIGHTECFRPAKPEPTYRLVAG